MDIADDPFDRANYLLRKAVFTRLHRQISKQHILRSQLGFKEVSSSSRPKACQGCAHYHGMAYGYSKATRVMLVCGFHPTGWEAESPCPDWSGISAEVL
jgi:hypothetical protein